jgi:Rad51
MNPEEVLDNVICARAHNSEQQMDLLSEAAALMSDSRWEENRKGWEWRRDSRG